MGPDREQDRAAQGAKRVAIANGGTIPDRGLYGVFLAGTEKKQSARVGELDEEMVFETAVGETFVLGASTWRIEEITHDKVIVTPAPGQPGKMPFWKADAAERTVPSARRSGNSCARSARRRRAEAIERLAKARSRRHRRGEPPAVPRDQEEATSVVPDDRTIVIERVVDELGDWRVCVLSPFGGKIHAPWAMAVTAKVRNELAIDVETMWSDDGFIVRFPETDDPPSRDLVLPDPGRGRAADCSGSSARASMFAAKFREAAARALLLPRTRIRARTPLWQQRKRAYDLLQVASRFGSFPIILETYREVLRDVFDVPALVET